MTVHERNTPLKLHGAVRPPRLEGAPSTRVCLTACVCWRGRRWWRRRAGQARGAHDSGTCGLAGCGFPGFWGLGVGAIRLSGLSEWVPFMVPQRVMDGWMGVGAVGHRVPHPQNPAPNPRSPPSHPPQPANAFPTTPQPATPQTPPKASPPSLGPTW
jgi:hypothetical protein